MIRGIENQKIWIPLKLGYNLLREAELGIWDGEGYARGVLLRCIQKWRDEFISARKKKEWSWLENVEKGERGSRDSVRNITDRTRRWVFMLKEKVVDACTYPTGTRNISTVIAADSLN